MSNEIAFWGLLTIANVYTASGKTKDSKPFLIMAGVTLVVNIISKFIG